MSTPLYYTIKTATILMMMMMWMITVITTTHQEMIHPNMTRHIILCVYLFTTEL